MMNLSRALVIMLVAFSSLVWGKNGLYCSVTSGVDFADELPGEAAVGPYWFDMDRSVGPVITAVGGYEWDCGWRLEGEIGGRQIPRTLWLSSGPTRSLDAIGIRTDAFQYMCNFGGCLASIRRFSPYALVGAGAILIFDKAETAARETISHEAHVRAAYQLILGVEHPIWQRKLLGVQYRLLHTWDVGQNHSVELVVRQKY